MTRARRPGRGRRPASGGPSGNRGGRGGPGPPAKYLKMRRAATVTPPPPGSTERPGPAGAGPAGTRRAYVTRPRRPGPGRGRSQPEPLELERDTPWPRRRPPLQPACQESRLPAPASSSPRRGQAWSGAALVHLYHDETWHQAVTQSTRPTRHLKNFLCELVEPGESSSKKNA